MTNPILSVHNLCKSFGNVVATNGVSIHLEQGEIHALIGPNGAGKSTLIQLIAGNIKPSSGRINFCGQVVTNMSNVKRAQLGLGRSFQISAIVPEFTVLENIILALSGRENKSFNIFKSWRKDKTLIEEAKLHAKRTNLGMKMSAISGDLAHGERRRLEIAMALALEPKVFLLDEPMAGLGAEGAKEITKLLEELK
ncbi:MAG: ATP-binding cassette domain-containing protein, partial [Rhizobiales bacterium]|nr:ATP-binding cassette domain-containing protein [Hyphomicrobiales bacterium]